MVVALLTLWPPQISQQSAQPYGIVWIRWPWPAPGAFSGSRGERPSTRQGSHDHLRPEVVMERANLERELQKPRKQHIKRGERRAHPQRPQRGQ